MDSDRKIGKFSISICIDNNWVRIDISMYNTMMMKMWNSEYNLSS